MISRFNVAVERWKLIIMKNSYLKEEYKRDVYRVVYCLNTIYSDWIIKNTINGLADGTKLGGRLVNNLRYVDDITIFAFSKEKLHALLQRLKPISKTACLILDRDKNTNRNNFDGLQHIDNIQVIDKFVYLRLIIVRDGDSIDESERRIRAAKFALTRLTKIWKSFDITMCTKTRRFTKMSVFSVFLYASECWKDNGCPMNSMFECKRMLLIMYINKF